MGRNQIGQLSIVQYPWQHNNLTFHHQLPHQTFPQTSEPSLPSKKSNSHSHRRLPLLRRCCSSPTSCTAAAGSGRISSTPRALLPSPPRAAPSGTGALPNSSSRVFCSSRSSCIVPGFSCTLFASRSPSPALFSRSCATAFRRLVSRIRSGFSSSSSFRLCRPWTACGRNACSSHLLWLLKEKRKRKKRLTASFVKINGRLT